MDAPKQTPSQKYYQKHKEEIQEKNKEKIKCECGILITPQNIWRHKKTSKHLLKAKIIKYEFIPDDEEDEAE